MIEFESFVFTQGMTIEAAIRLKNNYVHGEKLKQLMTEFNKKNGLSPVRPGRTYQIPVEITR